MFSHPVVNQSLELLSLLHKLLRLRVRCRIGKVVINLISLLPADIKVGKERCNVMADAEIEGLKCRLMMADSNHAESYFRQLQNGVVRRRKPAIRGKLCNVRIFEVSFNDGAEVVNLATAGLMRFHAPGVQ